jgi:MYXO-CTERM domain-containing protein
VASEGHEGDGYLEIDVRKCPEPAPGRAKIHVEVEIASFYPALALRLPRWIYANTQSRIHVLVTHGFLRSLAKLELEESAVGRFATVKNVEGMGEVAAPHEDDAPVTVGDTPWPAIGALAAGALAAAVLVARRRR